MKHRQQQTKHDKQIKTVNRMPPHIKMFPLYLVGFVVALMVKCDNKAFTDARFESNSPLTIKDDFRNV
ncbi:hypothetical protein GJ496_003916 [Pomphorhynchus laevis]|nr:hypothetical protein GJ496_003916 [Pomphorhynchus laevis]